MEGKNGNDRGGRETCRQKPWESMKGPVAKHDPSKTPDREGERKGQENGGFELVHGCVLSGSLEQRIVKI